MIGLAIKIEFADDAVTVPVTPRVAVNFERQFKIGLAKAFSTEEKLEHMYWLGWEALKVSGRIVKPFEEFLDSVRRVSFASEDSGPLAG